MIVTCVELGLQVGNCVSSLQLLDHGYYLFLAFLRETVVQASHPNFRNFCSSRNLILVRPSWITVRIHPKPSQISEPLLISEPDVGLTNLDHCKNTSNLSIKVDPVASKPTHHEMIQALLSWFQSLPEPLSKINTALVRINRNPFEKCLVGKLDCGIYLDFTCIRRRLENERARDFFEALIISGCNRCFEMRRSLPFRLIHSFRLFPFASLLLPLSHCFKLWQLTP